MTLKNQEEVKQIIGENTTLKFHFVSDNIISFYTVIPKIQFDEIISYKVEFFYESGVSFFDYDTFNNFLSKLQVFRLTEVNDETKEQTVLFQQQYKEN